ncbi:hypothetical protein [Ruminococcus sp. HUN007]|uniref:hypothetical protein n=1 Tax=Ruminococcus sp. HUN007 TaxID=1514668 RepID=UPI0005D2C626|nr:hypothetical protein [Ruminococcus sp. HUN007]
MNKCIKRCLTALVSAFICASSIVSVSAAVPDFIQGKWNYNSGRYVRTNTSTTGYFEAVYINDGYVYGYFSYDWYLPDSEHIDPNSYNNNHYSYIVTMTTGTYSGYNFPLETYPYQGYLKVNSQNYYLQ